MLRRPTADARQPVRAQLLRYSDFFFREMDWLGLGLGLGLGLSYLPRDGLVDQPLTRTLTLTPTPTLTLTLT